MRQTPKYMESIKQMASMQSVQSYGRDTVLRLISHIESTEGSERYWMAEYEAASKKAFRLIENVAQLQRELNMARGQKKVELPVHVANAIQLCRSVGIDEIQMISLMEYTNQLFRDYPNEVIESLIMIRNYSFSENGRKKLLDALANDYTIEQAIDHEQRLRIDIEQLVTTWDRTRPTSSLVKDIDERLDDYFQEIAK